MKKPGSKSMKAPKSLPKGPPMPKGGAEMAAMRGGVPARKGGRVRK